MLHHQEQALCPRGAWLQSRMTNSKQKGARGERAWVKKLAEFGYDSTRTGFHQSQTGCESPDVTCSALPVRWEVKNAERCLVRDWLAQVRYDSCRFACLTRHLADIKSIFMEVIN